MGFYDLSPKAREKLVAKIKYEIEEELKWGKSRKIRRLATDRDGYVRRTTYLSLARLYRDKPALRRSAGSALHSLFTDPDERVRQTMVNAFGEIGKREAGDALKMLEKALADPHHLVRNAVIGSLKKMGASNPKPTLQFAKKHIADPDPEVRRQIVHGIELRGRTHPQDILPLLKTRQFDSPRRVRNTLVHVLGQISYKQGCLEKVVSTLKTWQNRELAERAVQEILDVHRRYGDLFTAKSYAEARAYLEKQGFSAA